MEITIDLEEAYGDLVGVYGIDPLKFDTMPWFTKIQPLRRQMARQLKLRSYQIADLQAMIATALGGKKGQRPKKAVACSDLPLARDYLHHWDAPLGALLSGPELPKLDFDTRALKHIYLARQAGRVTELAWERVEPYWVALLNTIS